jgi:conjugal transfer pilus assembly protein TraF
MKYMKFMTLMVVSVSLGVLLVTESWGYADFYQKRQRGWFWFEQKAKTDLGKEVESLAPDRAPAQTAVEELEEFTAELNEAKAAMIMRPSVDNTKKFIEYQNKMFKKADLVLVNWRDAILSSPGLNIARDIPISDAGAKISKRAEESFNKELLGAFAKKFRLLFFYKSDCAYCTNFSEVLEVFATRYGFRVSAVTMDGKSLERFPGTMRGDLVEKFKVDYAPALFAYSEELGVAVPISQGFLAIDQLESNAAYVAGKLKERLGDK